MDYVSWKLGIKIENMPSRSDNQYFGYLPHRIERQAIFMIFYPKDGWILEK